MVPQRSLMFSTKDTLEGFEEEYKLLKQCMLDAPYIADFNNLKEYITQQTNLQDKKLIIPLRYALTGATNGPNLSEIYPLIKNYLGEIIK